MSSQHTDTSGLGPVIDEFVERLRRGEQPSLSHYLTRYPQWAEQIHELFPALVMMEQAGDGPSSEDGPVRLTADGQALKQLGEYRIVREIGRGGMGVVYEAEQESLGRCVALKILPYFALADSRQLKRFHREARAAASLHHTNIVPVFDVGQQDGVHYYAMQFIQGRGLDEVLTQLKQMRDQQPSSTGASAPTHPSNSHFQTSHSAPDTHPARPSAPSSPGAGVQQATSSFDHSLTLPGQGGLSSSSASGHHYYCSVARIGIQVADALAHAHQQGVLHRDVKPSNLLLDLQGTVWVTDFGLAKTDGEELTHTHDVVGTLRYLAPERLNGWSHPRSDLYSLGLTLYEMLTLRPAFEESDRGKLIKQISEDQPAAPCRIDRHVPRDLETIVLKAIAKEPSARYQTAKALREDLRSFLSGKPIVARRTPPGERMWLWCRRNPVSAGLTSIVVLLLIVIACGSSIAAWRLGDKHKTALGHLQRAQSAERRERGANRLATQQLQQSYLDQARAGRLSRQFGQRFDSLAAIRKSAELARQLKLDHGFLLALRNEAIACMALVDVERVQGASAHFASAWRPSCYGLDPNLVCIAIPDPNGNILIQQIDGRSPDILLPGNWQSRQTDPLLFTRFSRDGRYLAIRGRTADGSICVQLWDVTGQKRLAEMPAGGSEQVCGMQFSRDGQRLALPARDHRSIELLRTSDGRRESVIPINQSFGQVDFCPAGDHLLVVTGSTAQVYYVPSGEQLETLVHSSPIADGAWSPNGRLIATACHDANVYVWDISNAKRPWSTCRGHLSEVERVTFDQTSRLLMSVGRDMTTRIWDPFLGIELVRGQSNGVGISADNRWLVDQSASDQFHRLRFSDGRECRILCGNPGISNFAYLGFSPDSQMLYAKSRDGVAHIWNCQSGQQQHQSGGYIASRIAQFDPHRQRATSEGFFKEEPAGATPKREPPILDPQSAQTAPLQVNPSIFIFPPSSDVGTLSLAWFRHPLFCVDGRRLVAKPLFVDPQPHFSPPLPHKSDWMVDISPDGCWVAGGRPDRAAVTIWDSTSKEIIAKLPTPEKGVLPKFSPDGSRLIVGTVGQHVIYETTRWQMIKQIAHQSRAIGNAAFSHDMRLLAIAEQHDIRLYDARTLQLLAVLPSWRQELLSSSYPQGSGGVCFSPNDELLAVGTLQNTVQLWDLKQIESHLSKLGLHWDPALP